MTRSTLFSSSNCRHDATPSIRAASRSERSKGTFRQAERLKPCVPTNLLLAL